MCGIVGIINGSETIKSRLDYVFADMLFADQLRGFDGAGVFWYDKRDNTYQIIKDADFAEVWSDATFGKALKFIDKMPFMIGHNRSATRGSVKTENNHPFDEGNVILVHNGTMTYVPKEFDKDTVVDSHAIAKMINQASTEEFVKDSFGAYALVWFNKQTLELNLIRNKERPLNFVHFKDFIAIASEAGLAEWVGKRNGHEVLKIEPLQEHMLYQFEPYSLEPKVTDLSKVKAFPEYGEHRKTRYFHPLQGNIYGCEEIDEDDVWEAWEKTYKQPTNIVPIGGMTRKEWEKLDPWDYFKATHKIVDKVKALDNKSVPISLALGKEILFSVDDVKEFNQFSMVTGNIPGVPMNSYEVRGNIAATYDEIISNVNFMQGTITSIKPDKKAGNRVVVWLRDLKFSDMPDPAYAVEVEQEKK